MILQIAGYCCSKNCSTEEYTAAPLFHRLHDPGHARAGGAVPYPLYARGIHLDTGYFKLSSPFRTLATWRVSAEQLMERSYEPAERGWPGSCSSTRSIFALVRAERKRAFIWRLRASSLSHRSGSPSS